MVSNKDSSRRARALRRLSAWFGALPCAWLVSSCVSSPEPNAVVDATQQPVEFQGLLPETYGSAVTVQAFTTSSTWVNLGFTQAADNGAFSLSVLVPGNSWFPPCGTAIVRVVSDQNEPLLVIDAACHAALGPNPSPEEQQACNKEHVTLHQAHVHQGDLNLVGAEQAAPYQCLTHVVGNLTVNNAETEVVALPKLHEVTGNVDVTLSRYIVFDPRLPPEIITGRFEAPLLASIGGDLALHNTKDPSVPGGAAQVLFDFGMDAVTHVGGDVLVQNHVFPGNIKALNALTSLAGNLTVDWDENDVNSSVLLSSLRTVDGNLDVTVNTNANTLLQALERVGQDLTVHRSEPSGYWHAGPSFLGALERVEGSMTLQRSQHSTCNAFASLNHVGSTLRFEESTAGGGYIGASGAQHLSVGAFEMLDGLAAVIPAAADLEVRGAGNVTLSNNPNLCACTIDAFLAQLQGNGWSGSATTSGNGARASCVPCPPVAACR